MIYNPKARVRKLEFGLFLSNDEGLFFVAHTVGPTLKSNDIILLLCLLCLCVLMVCIFCLFVCLFMGKHGELDTKLLGPL